MGRPKEWERIARDQHISLQVILQSIAGQTEHLLMNVDGLVAKEILKIDRQVSNAIMLSRELQALIEDNDETVSDLERQVARSKYRIKGGR